MARLAAVWLALLLGCASEDDGDTCKEQGCKCTAEAGCDAGLECNASVDTCVPADCMPGFAACVCSDGQCTDGYHCADGICVGGDDSATSDPGSSGPDPTLTSTDPTTSSTAEDSTEPTATMATTEPAESTETAEADGPMPESSSGEASSSSGEPTCADEAECGACFECAIAEAGPCAEDDAACQGDDQCMGLETCASNCAADGRGGDCVNTCCGLFEDGGQPPYSTLSACLNDACGDICPDFAC
jgi:hypothetical protein